MAIEILKNPLKRNPTSAGPLTLPPSFDTQKYAAKWVKTGPAVAAAAEREYLVGAEGVTADGWLVWKDGDSSVKGRPHTVALQSGEHTLLCRDRHIQDAVNAIYGNVGKERMQQERRGETIGGIPVNEQSGMLNDARLASVIGSDNLEEGDVVMNVVENVKRVSTPTLLTST